MAFTVDVHEAKTHLSRLLDPAHAGQEIILAKAGKPCERLMPLAKVDEANEVHVSGASAWEVATQHRLGKLAEVPQSAARFAELVAADGFALLPIAQHHALKAGAYPHEHRDPFDRMLAAQSDVEGMTLVTCDAALPAFGCAILW